MRESPPLPVAVIGAGPVGLAAAAHLLARGIEPLVLEAGDGRRRQRARLGPRARLLALGVQRRPRRRRAAGGRRLGGARPPRRLPDRRRDRRALPRAARRAAGDRDACRYGARVTAVTRAGSTSSRTPAATRRRSSCVVDSRRRRAARARPRGDRRVGHVDAAQPARRRRRARRGRARSADRIAYGIPDVLGRDRERYAGKRVLVVGSGHSAFNVLLDLVELRDAEPDTEIVWAVRRRRAGPQVRRRRRRPAARARRARRRPSAGSSTTAPSSWSPASTPAAIADARRPAGGRATARASSSPTRWSPPPASAPTSSLLGELRLDLDDRVEAAARARAADRPERALLRLGAAARRRRALPPRRGLLRRRHEELRPRADLPAAHRLRAGPLGRRRARGDWEAARQVELVLPETGVCNAHHRPPAEPAAGAACCGAGSPHEEVAASRVSAPPHTLERRAGLRHAPPRGRGRSSARCRSPRPSPGASSTTPSRSSCCRCRASSASPPPSSPAPSRSRCCSPASPASRSGATSTAAARGR